MILGSINIITTIRISETQIFHIPSPFGKLYIVTRKSAIARHLVERFWCPKIYHYPNCTSTWTLAHNWDQSVRPESSMCYDEDCSNPDIQQVQFKTFPNVSSPLRKDNVIKENCSQSRFQPKWTMRNPEFSSQSRAPECHIRSENPLALSRNYSMTLDRLWHQEFFSVVSTLASLQTTLSWTSWFYTNRVIFVRFDERL